MGIEVMRPSLMLRLDFTPTVQRNPVWPSRRCAPRDGAIRSRCWKAAISGGPVRACRHLRSIPGQLLTAGRWESLIHCGAPPNALEAWWQRGSQLMRIWIWCCDWATSTARKNRPRPRGNLFDLLAGALRICLGFQELLQQRHPCPLGGRSGHGVRRPSCGRLPPKREKKKLKLEKELVGFYNLPTIPLKASLFGADAAAHPDRWPPGGAGRQAR